MLKYILIAWLVRKLNARIICAILTTMQYSVVYPKLFNTKNYCMKYFIRKIFAIYGTWTAQDSSFSLKI